MPSPRVGEPAPDVRLVHRSGRTVSLSAYWADRPAVAVFLRHYG